MAPLFVLHEGCVYRSGSSHLLESRAVLHVHVRGCSSEEGLGMPREDYHNEQMGSPCEPVYCAGAIPYLPTRLYSFYNIDPNICD
jgi:hypothetical protein